MKSLRVTREILSADGENIDKTTVFSLDLLNDEHLGVARVRVGGQFFNVFLQGINKNYLRGLHGKDASDIFYVLASQPFPSTCNVTLEGFTKEDIVNYLTDHFSKDEVKELLGY